MIVNIEPTWKDSLEHQCCSAHGLKGKVSEKPELDAIALGSVSYCLTGRNWKACDPYPDYLPWGRWICRRLPLPMGDAFFKPRDIPKQFESKVMSEPPKHAWVASRVLKFVQEWRAYVINGKIEATYCYTDFDDNKPISFPWKIPPEVTAAIDFGLTDDGKTLPVEVNDPYAIGWYGNLQDGAVYAKFVEFGWQSMLEKYKEK